MAGRPVTAAAVEPGALLLTEQAALDRCEKVIGRGLATFIRVGAALLEIRDGRLYRGAYATFEEYLAERWGISARHGRRLIQAFEVAREIGPIGPLPGTESQARELAQLLDRPDALRAAWERANEETGQQPTAAAVRDAVEETKRMQGDGQGGAGRGEDEELAARRERSRSRRRFASGVDALLATDPRALAEVYTRPADRAAARRAIEELREWCERAAGELR